MTRVIEDYDLIRSINHCLIFYFRYAYVEFLEVEAVQNATLLSESELHGRQLKVGVTICSPPGQFKADN